MSNQIPAQLLEPTTFPLHGSRLIEASAGTGKTFTIAALYLRLLLGHGSADTAAAEKKPLNVDQILVVTFTEAATEELRDRIRARIQEALSAFKGGDVSDPFLQQLLLETEDHVVAAELLELAARQMDEAAIFTIHGFCQRMLKQHAFESGSLFETELITDDSTLLRQAVLDIWRGLVYNQPTEFAEAVLSVWIGPDRLLAELRPLLSKQDLQLIPQLDAVDLVDAWKQSQNWLQQFCESWCQSDTDLAELIQSSGVNKKSYNSKYVPRYLAAIDQYAEGMSRSVPDAEIERFRQSVLASKTPAGKVVPEHPLFELCEQYAEHRLPLRELVISQTLQQIRKRFSELKQALRQLSFDDLLTQLDEALKTDDSGKLRAAITQQFPIALIDEFQDTDPMQYRIFSTLYSDKPTLGLFMIGDPKQAIYGFRGADIFTYIAARRSVQSHFTLATNWRSSSGMIDAVNSLFAGAERPFIYDEDIPFSPVKAADKADKTPLRVKGRKTAAMNVWYQGDQLCSRTQYLNDFADACAVQIAEQLELAAQGQVTIGTASLQASDIAILVRDRTEANAVRLALADKQIASVYLSSRESVFDTSEAIDLNLILQAVEEPTDERRLRAALATAMLDYPAQFLDQLNLNERLWESLVAEFTEYRECWQRLGIQPMLRRLMHQRQLAEKLLSAEQGERRLTDLLHLAEVLQKASLEQESSTALLRWYSEQLMQPNGDADEQRLRLESEEQLVTVITVHKSKGLEYPVVYLPFANSFRKADTTLHHDAQDRLCFDLDKKNKVAQAQADQERLAEDLRLLYVALTRSVYACYLGLANLQDGRAYTKSGLYRSALGYLLLNGAKDNAELDARLNQLTQNPNISLRPLPEGRLQRGLFDLEQEPVINYQAACFSRTLRRDWRMSSYSALVSHGSSYLPPLPGLDLEVSDESDKVEPIQEVHDIYSFPKGAQAGTFLHELFELIDFTDCPPDQLQSLLEERCLLAGYDELWIPVLQQLVVDVLNCPLDETGLSLSKIGNQQKLVEMEFMLPCKGLDAKALSRIISQHDPLSVNAGELDFDRLKGMLKGFIDLIFEYQGRYYVLDYKSNHLGADSALYRPELLAGAMLDHRYDLQYQLYSLALHRFLASRIPDYDFEQHFGGVYYLFLRGMRSEQPDNGVFFCRPSWTLVDSMDRLFRGEI